jgi:hypothetical protein
MSTGASGIVVIILSFQLAGMGLAVLDSRGHGLAAAISDPAYGAPAPAPDLLPTSPWVFVAPWPDPSRNLVALLPALHRPVPVPLTRWLPRAPPSIV